MKNSNDNDLNDILKKIEKLDGLLEKAKKIKESEKINKNE